VSGSGISWAICKYVPCSRQSNHASTPPLCFLQASALPAAQPTASKHWRQNTVYEYKNKEQRNASWICVLPVLIRMLCVGAKLIQCIFKLAWKFVVSAEWKSADLLSSCCSHQAVPSSLSHTYRQPNNATVDLHQSIDGQSPSHVAKISGIKPLCLQFVTIFCP